MPRWIFELKKPRAEGIEGFDYESGYVIELLPIRPRDLRGWVIFALRLDLNVVDDGALLDSVSTLLGYRVFIGYEVQVVALSLNARRADDSTAACCWTAIIIKMTINDICIPINIFSPLFIKDIFRPLFHPDLFLFLYFYFSLSLSAKHKNRIFCFVTTDCGTTRSKTLRENVRGFTIWKSIISIMIQLNIRKKN